jgi:hypothetical protein
MKPKMMFYAAVGWVTLHVGKFYAKRKVKGKLGGNAR